MANRTSQTTVGTTATAIHTGKLPLTAQNGFGVMIRNTGATDCYIGDSTVTSTTGYLLKAGESSPLLPMRPSELLYAVTATGTTTVHWFGMGVQ